MVILRHVRSASEELTSRSKNSSKNQLFLMVTFFILFINFFFVYFQGRAIGMCPKDKLFKGYIDLEIQLQARNRCRKLYEKFLVFNPENCLTWVQVSFIY